ncbi:MAG: uroporphyrinogen decarboxylase family protein [Kiritimatiellia bacterium]|nr:uroporphyrinogen decarboxylase family protein [Kiritimatiellia bacterium]
MTPREVIKRNLERKGTDRIGYEFFNPARIEYDVQKRDRKNDFCYGWMGPSKTWQRKTWTEGEFEFNDDEWGNIWHRVKDKSASGEIYKPALEDWAGLKDFKLPDFTDPDRYTQCRAVFAKHPDYYHLVGLPCSPFSTCRYLRKMEVYFQDLILERDHIDTLHERVTTLMEDVIRLYADGGADGVFIAEDWGTQERLLVSPTMWREIFKPLYRRFCGTAHRYGMHVLLHSCGYNWEILDDLAEVGINCFQFDQPRIYGLDRLADKLRSLNVCLFSPPDIQRVMPSGNKELIESEVRAMVRLFGGKQGGLIAKNYTDLRGIGVTPEADQWAYDAFMKAGMQP